MQRKNIPNYVLAKGISRVGFEQLLQDIRNAVIEEGLNEFCNYSELLNFIKEKDGANSEQWISEFEMQLNESTNVINENMAKIENLFARIFADWEVYKQEHDIVEEVKEEEKVEAEVPNEENTTSEDAAPVEVQLDVPKEEVKVELEPVVQEETATPEVTTEVPVEEAKEEPKEEVVVPTVEEKTDESVVTEEEKPKKEKKSKKDKSETEGDNNG